MAQNSSIPFVLCRVPALTGPNCFCKSIASELKSILLSCEQTSVIYCAVVQLHKTNIPNKSTRAAWPHCSIPSSSCSSADGWMDSIVAGACETGSWRWRWRAVGARIDLWHCERERVHIPIAQAIRHPIPRSQEHRHHPRDVRSLVGFYFVAADTVSARQVLSAVGL